MTGPAPQMPLNTTVVSRAGGRRLSGSTAGWMVVAIRELPRKDDQRLPGSPGDAGTQAVQAPAVFGACSLAAAAPSGANR